MQKPTQMTNDKHSKAQIEFTGIKDLAKRPARMSEKRVSPPHWLHATHTSQGSSCHKHKHKHEHKHEHRR
jgi:hypothetical protein